MTKRASAAAIAVGVAFAPTAVAHADNNGIAMAISDSTGHISIADGAASQGAAEKAAMDTCRKSISDCRLLASGQGGCMALVLNASKSKYFGAWGRPGRRPRRRRWRGCPAERFKRATTIAREKVRRNDGGVIRRLITSPHRALPTWSDTAGVVDYTCCELGFGVSA